jgi:hypothetical protein
MSDLARQAAAVRFCANRTSCPEGSEQLTCSFLRREVANAKMTALKTRNSILSAV